MLSCPGQPTKGHSVKVVTDKLSVRWPLPVTCVQCESMLELDYADLRYGSWKVSGYFFDGSAACELKYTFACPVCGLEANGNEIDSELIPAAQRRILQEHRRHMNAL